MTRVVNIPDETRVLRNVHLTLYDNVRRTLQQYTSEKLLTQKLVTRNFKNGLEFLDQYVLLTSLNRLIRLIKGGYTKNNLYANPPNSEGVYAAPVFVELIRSRQVRLALTSDPSINKYLGRLQQQINAIGIPIRIDINPRTDALGLDTGIMDVMFGPLYPESSPSSLTGCYYKLLEFLPEMLQVLRTLSRKARFTNETFTNLNKSKRFLHSTSGSPVGNGRDNLNVEAVQNNPA